MYWDHSRINLVISFQKTKFFLCICFIYYHDATDAFGAFLSSRASCTVPLTNQSILCGDHSVITWPWAPPVTISSATVWTQAWCLVLVWKDEDKNPDLGRSWFPMGTLMVQGWLVGTWTPLKLYEVCDQKEKKEVITAGPGSTNILCNWKT